MVIDVLADDSDPDTVIDPGNRIDPTTVRIPSVLKPDHGGRARINPDGTIIYTPAAGFTGIETFSYRVKDTYVLPTASLPTTVQVNVQ